jgi:hypothetical protein
MVMINKCLVSIAFAAAITIAPCAMAAMVTNGPQVNPGDVSANWSARRDVIESHRYDRLLETNRAFRIARMRKECSPVTDPTLHAQCIASFGQDEPYAGSSMPPHPYRSRYGR